MNDKKVVPYLSLIVLFGFLIRTIPFLTILTSNQINFLQSDHYYYLRRIIHILDSFPSIPVYDYFLTFPEKIDLPSPPFYPLFLTLISYFLTLGKVTQSNIELVTSFITALFGGMIAIPIYLIARKIVDNKLALITAFLSVVMVPHCWYTLSLAGDHHSIETFLGVLSLHFFIDLYQKNDRKTIFLAVLTLLGLFLVWQGAILYLALFILLVIGLKVTNYKITTSFIKVFIFVLILYSFFLFLIPPVDFNINYGRYSYSSVVFILFFLFFLLTIYFFDSNKIRKLIFSAIFCIFFFALTIKSVVGGFEFFSGSEKWFLMSGEMESFFSFLKRTNYRIFRKLLENALLLLHIFLSILGLFFMIKDWLNKRSDINIISFFLIITFFAILALTRTRFNYIFSCLMVISSVYLLKNKKILTYLYLTVSLFHISFFIFLVYNSYEKRNINPFLWLKYQTPSPIIEKGKPPIYSVHCVWDEGYMMVYYSNRPSIVNGSLTLSNRESFVDHFLIMATDNMEEFLKLLRKHKIRYIYYENYTQYLGSMYFNLLKREYIPPIKRVYNIIGFRNGFFQDKFLSNFRLVFNEFDVKTQKVSKIFEFVKGAKIIVKTKPNKELTITIPITTDNGIFNYVQNKQTNGKGEVIFVVPYSTNSKGVVKTGLYEIKDNKKKLNVSVTDSDVVEGQSIFINF